MLRCTLCGLVAAIGASVSLGQIGATIPAVSPAAHADSIARELCHGTNRVQLDLVDRLSLSIRGAETDTRQPPVSASDIDELARALLRDALPPLDARSDATARLLGVPSIPRIETTNAASPAPWSSALGDPFSADAANDHAARIQYLQPNDTPNAHSPMPDEYAGPLPASVAPVPTAAMIGMLGIAGLAGTASVRRR